MWKSAAVERAVLSGILQDKNGHLGILPVSVFREVLWPWVKHAARSPQSTGKAVPDVLYFRNTTVTPLSLSDSSEGIPSTHHHMNENANASDSDASASGANDDPDLMDSEDDGFFDSDDDVGSDLGFEEDIPLVPIQHI